MGVWEEAFSAFCDGLGSNNTLTHLDLRNNQISHHGAAALALALRRSGSLEELGDVQELTHHVTLRHVFSKDRSL